MTKTTVVLPAINWVFFRGCFIMSFFMFSFSKSFLVMMNVLWIYPIRNSAVNQTGASNVGKAVLKVSTTSD